jgi:hypothetical protein
MKDVNTWPEAAVTNLRGRWSRTEGATFRAEGKFHPMSCSGNISISISLPTEPISWTFGLLPIHRDFAVDHIAVEHL